MDPYTATREEFTNELADRPIPANASSEWSGQANALKDLLKKLAFHEAMRPNLQQTYMTPANSKNKVYCKFDNEWQAKWLLTMGSSYSHVVSGPAGDVSDMSVTQHFCNLRI